MRLRVGMLAVVAAASATSTPLQACDNSPDLMSIPGTTPEERQRRYDDYERDIGVIARLDSEKAALEESWTVYLATLKEVRPAVAGEARVTLRVQPVWAVRGLLPKGLQSLSGAVGGTCMPRSYLPIMRDAPGTLLVVFDEPGKRYAMSAEVARSGELINAIDMYALKVDPAQSR